MSEHTPTPWEISRLADTHVTGPNDRGVCSTGGYSDSHDPDVWETNLANAEFIVRACNAHAGLVEACKAALELPDLCEDINQSSEIDCVVAAVKECDRIINQLSAALAAVGE